MRHSKGSTGRQSEPQSNFQVDGFIKVLQTFHCFFFPLMRTSLTILLPRRIEHKGVFLWRRRHRPQAAQLSSPGLKNPVCIREYFLLNAPFHTTPTLPVKENTVYLFYSKYLLLFSFFYSFFFLAIFKAQNPARRPPIDRSRHQTHLQMCSLFPLPPPLPPNLSLIGSCRPSSCPMG